MSTSKTELPSIDPDQLTHVAGGAARGGDADLAAALSSIQSSIKDLAGSKNTGSDPMQMILMMMMMGGFGGGGGGGYVGGHAAVGTPPVINVDTGVSGGGGGGCRRRGKKGW